MAYRFIVADDHPLFRAALKPALLGVDADAHITEADTLSAVINSLEQDNDRDLLLLDLSMPDSVGYTGLIEIRHRFPSLGVAIVSAQDDVVVMRQSIALGAVAFIPKSAPLPMIVEALQTALNGVTWLPEVARQQSDKVADTELAERIAALSPQQYRVLCMVADGKLNKQIAYDLNVQETTIKQHVSAVLRKLGLVNRTQAGVLLRSLQQAGRLVTS
jgi:DNA-binding NarL/FixJ family response regulator